MPALHSEVKEVVRRQLQTGDFISFTTDVWTDTTSNRAYVSLTAHWIDANFERRFFLLNVRQLTESHSGVNLAEALKQLLKEWGVEEKVHAFIHDNASNAIKASEEAGFPFITCSAHTLQLVIGKAQDCQRTLIDAQAVARRLVGHYKHSTVAVARLNGIQRDQLNVSVSVVLSLLFAKQFTF
jgi:hypothetical protein